MNEAIGQARHDPAAPQDIQSSPDAAPAEQAVEEQPWRVPPAQPLRLIAAIVLLVCGSVSYGYVLLNFWSSPSLGIHMATPWPAYLLIALGLLLGLAAVRVALGLWSPHAKLAIAGLAFLASITFAVGGGRFVSYTLRGTRNPPFNLKLASGDRFPDFKLIDQNGSQVDSGIFATSPLTLVVVYRGDFCPFARFELDELTRHMAQFRDAGVRIVALSADPPQRSAMLSGFLHTTIPLLSDSKESVLSRLGLVQHYRSGQPDSAIPAFFLVDRSHQVRWIFTSPYYRQQPGLELLLGSVRAAEAVHSDR